MFERGNPKIWSKAVLTLIRGYQATRGLRTPTCRFYPSCSHYAADSISKYGLVNGIALSAIRMSKCHPFHNGGIDEVPEDLKWDWRAWNGRSRRTEFRSEFSLCSQAQSGLGTGPINGVRG